MPDPKAHWTILAYIATHNNLEDVGQYNLNQILRVGSTPELKLSVLYDRHDGATRYLIGQSGQIEVQEPLGNFDCGDPDALLETVRWAFERCPAEQYALVLGSHGSGWHPEEVERLARQIRGDQTISVREAAERAGKPGGRALFRTTLAQILRQSEPAERAICFDDGTGHSLDTLELERVMREIKQFIGQPLDLLGMDACMMASVEIAYQVRQNVRYLVASEELVPGYGWPYDTILGTLRATPHMAAHDLSRLVVQHFVAYYTKKPPSLYGGDVTKVALDLSRIGELVEATNTLAEALMADMKQQAKHLWAAQYETQRKETQTPWGRRPESKFNVHLWDLGTLATYLSQKSENAAVHDAARSVLTVLQPGRVVVAEGHRGKWFDGISGISIYAVPPGKQRISPYYQNVAFSKDTCWDEMLQAYHAALG